MSRNWPGRAGERESPGIVEEESVSLKGKGTEVGHRMPKGKEEGHWQAGHSAHSPGFFLTVTHYPDTSCPD